jgi:EmrB/QacA subfamily drug resistance transporter
VLGATILASSLIFIDGSVVTVALPAIRDDLGASIADAQWIANGYVLTLAAFTLLGGSAGDRFGLRRVFIVGVAAFALTSALCAAARSAELLIAARALQGLAGALVAPTSIAVIAAVYPEDKRGQAIGIWAAAAAVAPAAGPVLGGLIVEQAHWSWIFLINLPIAAAAAALAWRFLPRQPEHGSRSPLDWPGALLAAAGFGGLAWGLVALGEADGARAMTWTAIALGAAGLAAFVWREHTAAAPMLPLAMFRPPAFAGVIVQTTLMYAALSAAFFILPFVLIESRGWSVTAVGASFLPFTVAIAALSGPAGRVSDRWGPRRSLILGSALAAVGFGALGAAPASWGPALGVFAPMGMAGIGFAVAIAPLTTVALAAAPPQRRGLASGVSNAAARAAGLIGVALAAALAAADPGPQGLETAFRAVGIGAGIAAALGAAIAWLAVSPRIAKDGASPPS